MMKIIDIRTLRGPNFWSNYRKKLIQMQLDLKDYEQKPSNKIPNFNRKIKELMPTLYKHGCSYGEDGGFLRRLDEGTWAGHIIEHIALEMQSLAGMEVGYGRTRETNTPGVYHVVFAYLEEEAGRYAGRASVTLFLDIAENIKSIEELREQLTKAIQELREIREDVRFGPSTESIVMEAASRDIPYIRLNDQSLVQLGFGKNQRRIQATVTDKTNMISVDLASDKEATKKLLGNLGIPVPSGKTIRYEEDIEDAVKSLGLPLAVKPLNANHGKGITVNLKALAEVTTAFAKAKEYSRWVIIEKSLQGNDFRALVVNNKLIAVAERKPAHVIGDGQSSIKTLVEKTNQDPRRGIGHEKVLTLIKLDSHAEKVIQTQGFKSFDDVPKKDQTVFLTTTANISTGGTATDRTDEVHPYNVVLFERIARIIGLDIAGIDVVAPDISTPLSENGGGVIEVNAAPGFRMHLSPSEGIGRNVAEHVVDMLFPPGSQSRIPILAITGTNGKTTTTRLVSHLMKQHGECVGFTTTEGSYIGNTLVAKGDNTGPVSAQLILKDPTVSCAVLETARGGIIRAGLGFDKCDIGIVTNVSIDHLGLKGIETLDEMARVKSVVPRAVKDDGYAVLNADDDLVYGMRKHANGRLALYSMDENNPRILRHKEDGGIACVYENGYVTILKGAWKVRVEKVLNIPLTYEGRAGYMIQNVLAATLAAHLQGVSVEDLRVGLTTFVPSVAQTPGRLNLIDMGKFTVLIDFAHNQAGMEALHKFIEKFPNKIKTGIIGGTGDRRDSDIIEYGQIAAKMFTQVYVREDDDLRGRKEGEATRLVIEGLKSVNPDIPIKTIRSAPEAINTALHSAKKGELLTILADNVHRTIELVSNHREKLKKVEVDIETTISPDRDDF